MMLDDVRCSSRAPLARSVVLEAVESPMKYL